ncbi:DoxX family protein [Alloacidobacterium dinghuense]|uniref:DoxX family protein n=1 Tax=Alloacidobacterium dinghuense TaxID=2763107 RepID=A0A7G8BFL4_9BACT|nr:DoxX family protein [Alloacidobacterium dinghuense]QNI31334.1 DoxX family protein [Alloacidobacterium dinghuense]
MNRSQQPALTLFAIGLIGLGILALIYGDFALVWQPVAPWVPGRTALAYASGIIMLFGGIGLMLRITAVWSARILFPYLILWASLKLPAIFVAPQIEGVWLGLGELTVLLSGGWILFATVADIPQDSPLAFAAHENGIRIARYLFAVSVIPIGLSHIIYLKETADLVPAWLPFRAGWAYLTGFGHIASGLGVLFSVFPEVAAFAEAGMIGVFTLLVWGPKVVTSPKTRLFWTAFFISWVIAAAVWLVAQSILKPESAKRDTRKTAGVLKASQPISRV